MIRKRATRRPRLKRGRSAVPHSIGGAVLHSCEGAGPGSGGSSAKQMKFTPPNNSMSGNPRNSQVLQLTQTTSRCSLLYKPRRCSHLHKLLTGAHAYSNNSQVLQPTQTTSRCSRLLKQQVKLISSTTWDSCAFALRSDQS